MGYRVEIFTIETSLFGKITKEKLCRQLVDKLNDLEAKGYEVISVFHLPNANNNNYEYQIISKKPPQPEE